MTPSPAPPQLWLLVAAWGRGHCSWGQRLAPGQVDVLSRKFRCASKARLQCSLRAGEQAWGVSPCNEESPGVQAQAEVTAVNRIPLPGRNPSWDLQDILTDTIRAQGSSQCRLLGGLGTQLLGVLKVEHLFIRDTWDRMRATETEPHGGRGPSPIRISPQGAPRADASPPRWVPGPVHWCLP